MLYNCNAFRATVRPIANRGTRVEVTVEGRKQLADAADAWIRAGAPGGTEAARLQAVQLALADGDALLAMVTSGKLPRVVEYDKDGRTYRYNPMGRDVSGKQRRLIYALIQGRKGDRGSLSAGACTRLEILLDCDAEVTVGEAVYTVAELHQDVASPEERADAERRQTAKRERISRWLEERERASATQAPSEAHAHATVAADQPEGHTGQPRASGAGSWLRLVPGSGQGAPRAKPALRIVRDNDAPLRQVAGDVVPF